MMAEDRLVSRGKRPGYTRIYSECRWSLVGGRCKSQDFRLKTFDLTVCDLCCSETASSLSARCRERFACAETNEARWATGPQPHALLEGAQALVTFAAWRPLGPSRTSNSTWSFSFSDRNPSAWMEE